jgi:hypothetical protein
MSDIALEEVRPAIINQAPSAEFNSHVKELNRSLLNPEAGQMDLNEILDRVYTWENTFSDKVSQNEIEALQSLSLVLATVNLEAQKKENESMSDKLFKYKQSIETQRSLVRLVMQNLDTDGKPDQVATRSLSLITNVFERYFDPLNEADQNMKYQAGGFWQGVLGMVTAAQMFNRAGYKVYFPPEEADLRYDIDLVVENRIGSKFGVDVTESSMPKDLHMGEEDNNLFYVRKYSKGEHKILDIFPQLKGLIRINIPPARSYQAESFYEPGHRGVGCPSQESVDKMVHRLNS